MPPSWLVVLLVVLTAYAVLVLALVLAGRRGLAREAVLLLPNLIALFHGLLRDPAVPARAKLALWLGIAYFSIPIDVIPDFVPVVGGLDDAVVAALVLGYVARATGRATIERHWRGDPRIIARLVRE